MKNSLLIHHNNVAPLNFIDKKIKFNLINGDLDKYITDNIIPQIKNINPSILYIKDNLSSNYLELYGLYLSYHIRLSKELNDKRYIPIVILSDLDGYILNKLNSIGHILFTKNIFITQNSKESIGKFSKLKLKNLTSKEYQNSFLNLINIEPPENSTSHNIANEWAIYRWAEFLKVESKSIQSNNNKINSMLYFKYLLAKNPIKKDRAIGCKRVKNSGKILYIDDEWKNGWSDIFESYFNKSSNIDFETFEYEFKDKNIFQVGIDIQKMVEECNPDLVILDLRLIENDHRNINREDISNYTGIKILEDIKKINQGIQVLMLTATSKSTILDKLYEYDILGYIKKEHPLDKHISTKDNLNKLAYLVDMGLEKSYLKEIWCIQNSILKLDLSNEIKFEVTSVFEILDSGMDKRYTYAMLSIFQSLEEINNIYINDKTGRWIDNNREIEVKRYTKPKILEILYKRLELNDFNNDIDDIAKMRKDAIHPPQKSIYKKPTKENILTWFKMLETILEKVSNDKPNN